jgi:hypothetical protein
MKLKKVAPETANPAVVMNDFLEMGLDEPEA